MRFIVKLVAALDLEIIWGVYVVTFEELIELFSLILIKECCSNRFRALLLEYSLTLSQINGSLSYEAFISLSTLLFLFYFHVFKFLFNVSATDFK